MSDLLMSWARTLNRDETGAPRELSAEQAAAVDLIAFFLADVAAIRRAWTE